VVIQDDRFDATASVTVVPFASSDVDAPLLRVGVQPSDTTGLAETSRLMIDKVATVPRTSLTRHVGRLSDGDLVRLHRALLVFLGLARRKRLRLTAAWQPASSRARTVRASAPAGENISQHCLSGESVASCPVSNIWRAVYR
jgi:mRNA interferase MazF